MTYDAGKTPAPAEWLAIDEAERIVLVETWHRRQVIRLPTAPQTRLHATIHAVVENQLAMGITDVVDALARLQAEGLTRHEAIHAIGSAVAGQMFKAFKAPSEAPPNLNEAYLDRVRSLTAEEWRHSGEAS